jgi:hypothetical protein
MYKMKHAAIQDLIMYGAYKHPAEHGLSEEQIQEIASTAASGDEGSSTDQQSLPPTVQHNDGQSYLKRPDPTGRRLGLAPTPDKANTLRQTIETAKLLVQSTKVHLCSD